jgi:ornithine cyclodeaminase/alanine dehydrogenase-like protein (mu-crystallin family)
MIAPPTLLLSRSLVSRLATPNDYLHAVRSAFADMALGRMKMSSVGHVSGLDGSFHIKAASQAIVERPFAVVKVNGNFPQNGGRYQLPTIQGFIALLDAQLGCVLALMDTIEITARRTAAATALAAQCLADPKSHILGIIGCGVQARYHVEALAEIFRIFRIDAVLYCDINDTAAQSFEAFLRDARLQARRVCDAKAASQAADIVVTLTPSRRAVLKAADVAPGTFVAGVGADNPMKQELASDLLRASHVVVDSLVQASTMGDLHHAIERGEMTIGAVYCELADLVVGRAAGRTGKVTRWVFESTGLAIQDLAAAKMVYALAQADQEVPRIMLND